MPIGRNHKGGGGIDDSDFGGCAIAGGSSVKTGRHSEMCAKKDGGDGK